MSIVDTTERRATWFELLFDLVFVAAVGRATHRLAAHPSWPELLTTIALFVPLWWTWVIYTYQANRYETERQPLLRTITLLGTFGICVVAVALPGVGSDNGSDVMFIVGYLVARYVVAALYVLVGRKQPIALAIAVRYTTGSLIASVGWIGGLLLPAGPWRITAWVLAMLVELILPFTAARPASAVQHHVEHLRERFGLFTIIVIGESMLSIVTGMGDSNPGLAAGFTAVCGFILAVCLWQTYFQTGSDKSAAGFPRESLRHMFTYGHLPAQVGLAITGAGVLVAIAGAQSSLPGPIAAAVFGGVAAYLLAISAIRSAFQHSPDRIVAVRGIAAGAAILLGVAVGTRVPAYLSVGLLTLILLAATLTETRLRTWVA